MKKTTVNGKTFKSIKEACDYYNLPPQKIRDRLKNDWSIEEAFELVERKSNYKKSITLEGKTFKSVTEACKYYNLNYNTIEKRLSRGWTLEQAFELVPIKNLNEITLEGKTFINIKEACKYYNLEYKTVRSRLYKSKWTIEEAFELVERIK